MDLTGKDVSNLSTVIQKRMSPLQELLIQKRLGYLQEAGLSKPDTTFRYNPPTHDPEGLALLYGVLLKGYISTWDVDEINDKFVPGAFRESIQKFFIEHTKRFGAPYIKLLRVHEELAAIIHYLVEDEKGLYVEFWCLNTDIGRRFYVEVATGAINQMSVGFIPRETDDGEDVDGETPLRLLIKADVLEGSGVLWPCNYATDVGVNSMQHGKALPVLDEKKFLAACGSDNEAESTPVTVDKSITEETVGMKDLCKSITEACEKHIEKGEKLSPADHRAMVKALFSMSRAADLCYPGDDVAEAAAAAKEAVDTPAEPPAAAQASEAGDTTATVKPNEPDIAKQIAALMEIQEKTLVGVAKATATGKES